MAKKRKVKETNQPSVTAAAGSSSAAGMPGAGIKAIFADRRNLYIALGLLAGCFILYGQTVGFAFITIDDSGYIYTNSNVLAGLSWENIKWAFTTYAQGNWHPVTWLSLLTDTSLFGAWPGAYHFVNALLHAINSVFLFVLLKTLTGSTWRSAMVSALFAFHPAHVESVAWISERKDVLSTFFWILATYFYAGYVARKNERDAGRARNLYILTIAAMALGVMAKPMVVTLPFTLLLLDYWPLRRLEDFSFARVSKLVIEKLPLFALSVISSIFTVFAQKQSGSVAELAMLAFPVRVSNALVAYAKYVVMMFYPVNLGIVYPYEVNIPAVTVAGAALLLAAISIYCIWTSGSKKYLLVGWLWFLGTLVPVIGLVQVGAQSMADRYTYVPYVGLFIMAVWLAADLLRNLDRRIVAAAAVIVLAVFGVLTFRQTTLWRDSEVLYLHTELITQRNGFIEESLCYLYLQQDRLDEAETRCKNSIEYSPGYFAPYSLLGTIYFRKHNVDEAAKYYTLALQLRPDDLFSFSDLTLTQIIRGNVDEGAAMTDKMASATNSEGLNGKAFYQNYYLIGMTYSQKSDHEKAAVYWQKALDLKPDDSDLRANVGFTLYKTGKKEEGVAQVREAIKQDPSKAESRNMLGTMLSADGKPEEAIKEFEEALRINPDFAPAKNNLQKVKSRK
jgi:tetratricopeptide (TPR) repeat protein